MSHTTESDFYGDGSDHEGHSFECDGKGCRAFAQGEGTFHDVWEETKKQGWVCRPKRIGTKIAVWEHFCPTCKDKKGD